MVRQTAPTAISRPAPVGFPRLLATLLANSLYFRLIEHYIELGVTVASKNPKMCPCHSTPVVGHVAIDLETTEARNRPDNAIPPLYTTMGHGELNTTVAQAVSQ